MSDRRNLYFPVDPLSCCPNVADSSPYRSRLPGELRISLPHVSCRIIVSPCTCCPMHRDAANKSLPSTYNKRSDMLQLNLERLCPRQSQIHSDRITIQQREHRNERVMVKVVVSKNKERQMSETVQRMKIQMTMEAIVGNRAAYFPAWIPMSQKSDTGD